MAEEFKEPPEISPGVFEIIRSLHEAEISLTGVVPPELMLGKKGTAAASFKTPVPSSPPAGPPSTRSSKSDPPQTD